MKRKIFSALVCTCCFLGLSFSEGVKAEERKEVSQYGITWTFDKPVKSGQFITGDWWVVGPVTVTKVTPAPGIGVSSGGTKTIYGEAALSDNTEMRNGSMVANKCGYDQGYDSRSGTYNSALSKKFPCTLEVNQSLISTISNTSFPVDNFCKKIMWDREARGAYALKTAAVLTCLATEPPEDAFRPCYVGKDKILYREQDVKWELLPKLSPTGSVPSWEQYERYFQRPWLENLLEWGQQALNANENQPNYGREHARLVSTASVLLCLDVPKERKRKLAIGLIQYGIDISGCGKNGGNWNWGGGHSSGRKWPVVFATLMLNDPKLSEFPVSCVFHEDAQTYYGKSWFGATALWQMVWHHHALGTYEDKRPEQITETWLKKSEGYRVCCNAKGWVGTAFAARYMKGIKTWGHDAFFDYMDRWMNPVDLYKSARPRPKDETTSYEPFEKAMWDAYRKSAPEQEMSGKNMMWVASAGAKKGSWVPNSKP